MFSYPPGRHAVIGRIFAGGDKTFAGPDPSDNRNNNMIKGRRGGSLMFWLSLVYSMLVSKDGLRNLKTGMANWAKGDGNIYGGGS